jgi:hypothetical protein
MIPSQTWNDAYNNIGFRFNHWFRTYSLQVPPSFVKKTEPVNIIK